MKFKAFTLILVLLAGLSGCTSYKTFLTCKIRKP